MIYYDYAPSLAPEKYVVAIAINEQLLENYIN